MVTPVIRFRIDFAMNSWVGPGKIELLEAIRGCGSLTRAARSLDMSYRRAWLLLDNLNSCFQEPVTLATTGGKGGGGVTVTTFGESLIASYRELELDIASAAARRLPAIARAVAPKSRSSAIAGPRPLVKH